MIVMFFVTTKVDSSAPLRPRLNPRATGAKPHRGSAVQPRGLGNRSPEVQLRAKKQAEVRYVSSYCFSAYDLDLGSM